MKSLTTTQLKSSFCYIFSLLLLLIGSNTWACTCLPDSFEEDFQTGEFVFSGKVLSVDKPVSSGFVSSAQLVEFEFELQEEWKGELASKITVSTELAVASCGFPFEVGKRYVVLARKMKPQAVEDGAESTSDNLDQDEEESDAPVKLYTNLCFGTQELKGTWKSRILLRKLKALKTKNEKSLLTRTQQGDEPEE